MASGGDIGELTEAFKKFNMVGLAAGKDPYKMTNKAWGKLVVDCIGKDTTMKQRMDSSVWPYVQDKTSKTLDLKDKEKMNKTMDLAAKVYKEVKKSKESEAEIRTTLIKNITGGGPDVKGTKTSKTGNVGGLTDASQYTGSHKERFDASGKGKGIEGREDRADNSGYVGNYKGADTFDKKK